MDFNFLSQADNVTLKLELAKRALENAKADLDKAKQAYEELFSQAENHGIAKAKLKKLTEERVQALFENGVISGGLTSPGEPKRERPVKKPKKTAEAKGNEEALSEEESSLMESHIENEINEIEMDLA